MLFQLDTCCQHFRALGAREHLLDDLLAPGVETVFAGPVAGQRHRGGEPGGTVLAIVRPVAGVLDPLVVVERGAVDEALLAAHLTLVTLRGLPRQCKHVFPMPGLLKQRPCCCYYVLRKGSISVTDLSPHTLPLVTCEGQPAEWSHIAMSCLWTCLLG